MHVLPDISRNKGNQIIKCVQLTEYSMKIIFFLKNHEQNMVEKLFPDPFENIKIEHISGSAAIIFIQFGFTVCPNRVYQNILKLRC